MRQQNPSTLERWKRILEVARALVMLTIAIIELLKLLGVF